FVIQLWVMKASFTFLLSLFLFIVKRVTCEAEGLRACDALHAAGPSKVVITSLDIDGTLLLIGSHQKIKGHPAEQFKIAMPKIPAYFTGTGDLMTALLLGWSNKYPEELWKASELAVSSLQEYNALSCEELPFVSSTILFSSAKRVEIIFSSLWEGI
ncbi:hypothetical protein KI387_010951, partial [Taxus chinensis]